MSESQLTMGPLEPKTDSRWVITTKGFEIPKWLFRNYKLYNDGEDIIVECEIIEPLHITFNPADYMKITDILVEYLDPVGIVVSSLLMEIKGLNFVTSGDYESNELKKTKFLFKINPKKIKNF
jgi:hypothetical protein